MGWVVGPSKKIFLGVFLILVYSFPENMTSFSKFVRMDTNCIPVFRAVIWFYIDKAMTIYGLSILVPFGATFIKKNSILEVLKECCYLDETN